MGSNNERVRLVRKTEEDKRREQEEKAKKRARKEAVSEKDRLKKKIYTRIIAITSVLLVLALLTLAGMATGVLSSKVGIILLLVICLASTYFTRSNQMDK